MRPPSIDKLIQILNGDYYGKKSNLKVGYNEETDHLNRMIQIETELGDTLQIEWWVNILYIHYYGAIIPCHNIKLSSTWPNNSLLNIQAEYFNKQCFILPIRNYPKELE